MRNFLCGLDEGVGDGDGGVAGVGHDIYRVRWMHSRAEWLCLIGR